MAKKKRKKLGWLPLAVFCLTFPIAVWVAALLLWFFWADLTRPFSKQAAKPTAAVKSESKTESKLDKAEKDSSPQLPEPVTHPSEEKLVDEDRRKLDAIIKRLQQRQSNKEG